MNLLTRTMTLLLLAIWGLAASHCDLECVAGLEFLACSEQTSDAAPHQNTDCEQDGCAVVESGLYKSEERAARVPSPLLLALNIPALFRSIIAHSECSVSDGLSSAPPELAPGWQFSSRTALPPRAPSFVS